MKLLHLDQFFKDYFSFSTSEQRGIVILGTLLILLLMVSQVIPREVIRPPTDFSRFDQEVMAFETAWRKTEDSIASARRKKLLFSNYHSDYHTKDTFSHPSFQARETFVIDLNTADTFDLQRLRGIGSSFARRIVNYRGRLGGFIDKRQLLEVFGMDRERYEKIEDNVNVTGDSVRQIDINNVTFKELLKHPYFPFEITKAIMLYRQKNKKFKTLDDLHSVPGISDSVFKKIVVYLEIIH